MLNFISVPLDVGKEQMLGQGRLPKQIEVSDNARHTYDMFALRQQQQQLAANEDNDAENQDNIADANNLEHQMIIAQQEAVWLQFFCNTVASKTMMMQ